MVLLAIDGEAAADALDIRLDRGETRQRDEEHEENTQILHPALKCKVHLSKFRWRPEPHVTRRSSPMLGEMQS